MNAEISTVLSENAAGIEKIFEEIDELNHGWLTIESLYQARFEKSKNFENIKQNGPYYKIEIFQSKSKFYIEQIFHQKFREKNVENYGLNFY